MDYVRTDNLNLTDLDFIYNQQFTDFELITNYCYFLNDTAGEFIILMFTLFLINMIFDIINSFIKNETLIEFNIIYKSIMIFTNFLITFYLVSILFVKDEILKIKHLSYITPIIIIMIFLILFTIYKKGFFNKIIEKIKKGKL